MKIKDADVKKFALNKIRELRQEITKWEKVLGAFADNQNKPSQENNIPQIKPRKLSVTSYVSSSKITIQHKVIEILKKYDRPVLSTELIDSINNLYPEKIYNMKSFSGAFSAMYRKPNSGIKQYSMKNATLQVKAVYGLSEWFDESGGLKPKYQDKVKEVFGTL